MAAMHVFSLAAWTDDTSGNLIETRLISYLQVLGYLDLFWLLFVGLKKPLRLLCNVLVIPRILFQDRSRAGQVAPNEVSFGFFLHINADYATC